jgi:hypothetical protein
VTDLLAADDTVLHRGGRPPGVQVCLHPLPDTKGDRVPADGTAPNEGQRGLSGQENPRLEDAS